MTELEPVEPPKKKPVEHVLTVEKVVRLVAVYAMAIAFALCMFQGGGLSTCCGPVKSFLQAQAGVPPATPAPTP